MDYCQELFRFIEKTPTAFHAVANAAEMLAEAGAEELSEREPWDICAGKIYYVIRNDSALIAFCCPQDMLSLDSYRVFAAHGDSPSFKLKEHPEIIAEDKYIRLNTERYGGMILYSWLDRPLSVAGRVIVKNENGLESRLVNIDRDLLVIPSLAIHMNREVNNGYKFNPQTDMLPLYAGANEKDTFMKLVAESAGVEPGEILGQDLFLYVREAGRKFGAEEEYFCAPRIDDLECVFGGLKGFLAGKKQDAIAVYTLFDNEEVGSGTRQGAASTFLKDTLERISDAISFMLKENDLYEESVIRTADSFMVSADNGHALHPNHPEVCDPSNRPVMNGGILLKYSANQRYTSDGLSAAIFKDLCNEAGAKYQLFFNRSDMLGGSTLGNLSQLQVPFNTVDIGLPQLAMHSAIETAGCTDLQDLIVFSTALFS